MIRAPAVSDLLDRADAERTAGRGETAARLYDEAVGRCRDEGDLAAWTRAVLGAASVHLFGVDPGKVPAQLYDVLARTTDDADRARLGAALARCWAYAGQPERGARFADEAVDRAERAGRPELLADCLDAALATHWGPDELDVRRPIAARLDEVVAHVLDPDARLQSHLWGLQVACESLDLQAIYRHLRVLERLGEESPRAQFFAASRRLMLDLLRGRTDTTPALIVTAEAAAERAALADAWLVLKAMPAYSGAFSDNPAGAASGAAECEEFGLAEGIPTVCAEAAFLWVCAGHPERARSLVNLFSGTVLDELPRDMNWLLTLQCVLEAALAVDDRDVIETAAGLLAPYEGRAVINGGGVMFHGVTDDPLARAAAVLGDAKTAERLAAQALATYERIGARWWRDRLRALTAAATGAAPVDRRRMHLHPTPGGLWLVGPAGAAVTIRGLRGFGYLRELARRPGQPVASLDLVGAGTGVVAESGLGELADRPALAAYRQRLRDLDADLAEAKEWADQGRVAAAQAERDALLGELGRATGLGGRARTAGSSHERARVAVQKAITAAIDRIETIDADLGRHLRAHVRTGLTCSYEPEPDDPRNALDWVLD
jgi:tetratricopeptide (TPR) repeat protein